MNHLLSTGVVVSSLLLSAGPTLLRAEEPGPASRPGLVAFPGAEGFGALATGGRGGEVVHVTTLNDDGPGSLREAVSQPNRTVVFDIGGTIRIKKQIAFSSNLTVAGQTAPGGITIYGSGISLSNQSNIIVRYLSVRCGSNAGRSSKALNITNGHNIIVDHLSLSWASWDNAGLTGKSTDLTVQNCILSEAIKVQKFGAIIDGVRRTSVLRNLWSNNRGRNPKGKGDLQFINNVTYNWGGQGYGGGHSGAPWNQDLIGNYWVAGPDSNGEFFNFTNKNDIVYSEGNYVDLDKDGQLNGRAWTRDDITRVKPKGDRPNAAEPKAADAQDGDEKEPEKVGPATPADKAFNQSPAAVTVKTAEQAVQDVIAGVGNSLYRDSVDQRQIDQLKSFGKLGKNPDSEDDVGGLPATAPAKEAPADTDRDGLPDAWETAHGLAPNDPKDGNAVTASGYTNLETYLNSLVP